MVFKGNDMKTPNVVYHNATVTREWRNKLNGHKSAVIWFTGLSGSGKSTLAHSVEEELHNLGCRTFVLDGDNVRHGLSSNLTFSDDGLNENIRRIVEAAKLMMEGWRYYFECIHHSINNKLYLYCTPIQLIWKNLYAKKIINIDYGRYRLIWTFVYPYDTKKIQPQ